MSNVHRLHQKFVIQIMGPVGGRMPPVPTYVLDFDPNADGGRGNVIMTQKREEAKRFDSTKQAYEFYMTQSTTVPLRPDGRPNRPLTAYNITIQSEASEPV